jgi:hypothetical protein
MTGRLRVRCDAEMNAYLIPRRSALAAVPGVRRQGACRDGWPVGPRLRRHPRDCDGHPPSPGGGQLPGRSRRRRRRRARRAGAEGEVASVVIGRRVRSVVLPGLAVVIACTTSRSSALRVDARGQGVPTAISESLRPFSFDSTVEYACIGHRSRCGHTRYRWKSCWLTRNLPRQASPTSVTSGLRHGIKIRFSVFVGDDWEGRRGRWGLRREGSNDSNNARSFVRARAHVHHIDTDPSIGTRFDLAGTGESGVHD